MLIDDVTIQLQAGKGGKGAVAFNKSKNAKGPNGGNGGDGGSIYMEGVSDLSALNRFRFKKVIEAEAGKDGRGDFVDGKRGPDLVLNVPIGTVIHNLTRQKDAEITRVGERVLVARGGTGGRGNFLFRSSTNTTPMQHEEGLAGEAVEARLELKLIADIGLIGLPNVGKSSLLNELTRAKSKVANYPFTTLEPHLGVYYGLILADIPGLIEGASSGKGLGVKFLRHIERTTILFHLISAESNDPLRDYRVVREELRLHNPELLQKPEYVFLAKSDAVPPSLLDERIHILRSVQKNSAPLSILDDASLENLKKILNEIADAKTIQ